MLTRLFDVNVMFVEDVDGKVKYAMSVQSHDGTSEKDIYRYMKEVMDDWTEKVNKGIGA